MIKILYLDDELSLLEITKIYLERNNSDFKIDTTLSFKEAYLKIASSVYDVVISDYEMPEMSGIDFLKYVRTHYNDLPFILFTGKGREDIVIEALNNGADFYLQKGGEPRSLFAELEHKVRLAVSKREMEKDLLESKQRMVDIINHLPDATLAVDRYGKVITWNKAIQEMTGISSEVIVGKGDYEYSIPFYGERKPLLLNLILNEDPEIEKKYSSFFRTGDRLISEIFISTFNQGNGAHLRTIASPLYDRDNNVIGAIQSIRDITDLKHTEDILFRKIEELNIAYEELSSTEEELRQNYEELNNSQQQLLQSEERYRDVVEDQTEFICRFTPDGKITFVNGAYCRYFGLDKESCIGVHHAVIIPSEDRQLMKQHLAALTPQKSVAVVEHRVRMPDGETRWQQWTDRAIFDNNGHIIEFQSVGRDITGRKEAEEKLKRMNEELHSAYEQLAATEEELRQNYDELKTSQQLQHRKEEELNERELDLRESENMYRDLVELLPETIFEFDIHGFVTSANSSALESFGYTQEELKKGLNAFQVLIPEDRGKAMSSLQRVIAGKKQVITEYTALRRDGSTFPVIIDSNAIIHHNKPVGIRSIIFDITGCKQAEEVLSQVNKKLNMLNSITRHDILNQLMGLRAYLELSKEEIEDTKILEYIEKEEHAAEIIQEQIEFTRTYQDIGMQAPKWLDLEDIINSVIRQLKHPGVDIEVAGKGLEVFSDPLIEI
ncbi:MAG: PAS domain S-box protein, partial [Methanobacteriota archaeon]